MKPVKLYSSRPSEGGPEPPPPQSGDLAYVVGALLQYLADKGQVYSAAQLAALVALEESLRKRFGVAPPLGALVEKWVALSVIERSRWKTVAQANAEQVSRIGMQVNYIQEQARTTRVLPIGGRRS